MFNDEAGDMPVAASSGPSDAGPSGLPAGSPPEPEEKRRTGTGPAPAPTPA